MLLGLFVLVKAVDYWLDRFDLTTDQGRRFTGINYTAFHAQLPAKNILMFIAVICAVLFFANVAPPHLAAARDRASACSCSRRSCSARCGPGSCGSSRSSPPSPTRRSRSSPATSRRRAQAYGVDGIEEQDYDATVNVTSEQLQAQMPSRCPASA